MSWLALSYSFEYLCYGSTAIGKYCISFSAETVFIRCLQTLNRRQILTCKDIPRAEKGTNLFLSVKGSCWKYRYHKTFPMRIQIDRIIGIISIDILIILCYQ